MSVELNPSLYLLAHLFSVLSCFPSRTSLWCEGWSSWLTVCLERAVSVGKKQTNKHTLIPRVPIKSSWFTLIGLSLDHVPITVASDSGLGHAPTPGAGHSSPLPEPGALRVGKVRFLIKAPGALPRKRGMNTGRQQLQTSTIIYSLI